MYTRKGEPMKQPKHIRVEGARRQVKRVFHRGGSDRLSNATEKWKKLRIENESLNLTAGT